MFSQSLILRKKIFLIGRLIMSSKKHNFGRRANGISRKGRFRPAINQAQSPIHDVEIAEEQKNNE